MIHAAKQSYYHSKIQDAEDQKGLFKVVNTLHIRIWMRASFLKCNGDKTEILLIGSQRHTASISLDGITIDNAVISPSTAARNLGVISDSKMSLVPQVGAVCQSVRDYLHIIGRIRRYI